MPLLRSLRFLFLFLLLATLIQSLMLSQSAMLTSGVAVCGGIGWLLGRWIRVQGYLACQIARAVLMALSLAGGAALESHIELEQLLLTYCGFGAGLMLALTSPRRGGRRSRRACLQRQLQVFFASVLSHRPLRSARAMVRSL